MPKKYYFAAAFTALLLAGASHQAQASEVKVEAELGQSVLSSAKAGHVYLRLNLKAQAAAKEARRAPVNIALVLDRSGSMQGARLAAAKEAAKMALARLGRDDTIAVVSFSSGVEVMQAATHLVDQTALKAKIEAMRADGQTALYAGVMEGGREAKKFLEPSRINRVILMSDGQANVGPSSPKELAELGRELGGKGISVTTIGLGLDYNEDLMQRLAAASDGNHAFAENPADLVKFFNSEFGDALNVAAQDLIITIEVKSGFTPHRVLNREGTIDGQRITLKLNHLQTDTDRSIVVELDTAAGRSEGDADVADVTVDYLDLDASARRKSSARLGARFSASDGDVEASLNKSVSAQVTAQIATEQNEKALELRDSGDVAGAKKLLQDNAAFLNFSRKNLMLGISPAAPAAAAALDEQEKQNRAEADGLDADKWDKTRKMMRTQQHKTKSGQSY